MPMALSDSPALFSSAPVMARAESLDAAFEGEVPSLAAPRPRIGEGVSRRPGREQGFALERLGHAVEYLIDSRMFLTGIAYTRSEEEALQMLMAASRKVFEGCPEVVPFTTGLKNRLLRGWHGMWRSDEAGSR